MALSVIARPQANIADMITSFVATVGNDSGSALISFASHGLVTGNYVYLDSNFSAYNGYWYVVFNDVNSFFIREYGTAANEAYINTGDVTFYKTIISHNWSCVHLPIVYKLKSTLWPTNSADTVRTVTSISNDAGYVNLNLSGDIKATGASAELEFVKITGQNAGIYQIINWVSDSDITIDSPFVTGTTFAGSFVQYYYNNYHARIKVHAGLATSHYWTAQKPYTLILELKLVPDATGIINLNISEHLKEKIKTDENNLALDTLPNDINAFTQFYITYAEAYDFSSGYTLGTSVSSYTNDGDTFVGYAVNAILPFKTQSGD